MKKTYLLLLSLWSCQPKPHVDVTDIRQAENIVLQTTKQYPHRLVVQIRGYVNDTALIGNVKIGKGKVETVYYDGDYYQDTFELPYYPYRADSGHLRIDYQFFTN